MPKTPSYRQRAGYSSALVTLTDSATGKRRDYWLGPADSPESREAYHRVIAEWEAGGRRLPASHAPHRPAAGSAPGAGLTVGGLIRDYWAWAKTYYSRAGAENVRMSLRVLRQLYGGTPAADFGPNALRTVREAMVRGSGGERPRRPWCRGTVNQGVGHVVRMFRWASSVEALPPSLHQALAAVAPLKRGRCSAREHAAVAPADPRIVQAVRALVGRQVAALIDLQLLTGARPGELLPLRLADLETSEHVWTYRPREHKNSHRQMERTIHFGPRAQEVLRPFMAGRRTDEFLFSPAEADRERRAALLARRRTPLSCGNRAGTARRARPKVQPGVCYSTPSYRRAIERACDRAFPPPEHLRPRVGPGGRPETDRECLGRLTPAERAELAAWRKAHRFHPHQLRHNAGTEIRRQFGLEAAALVLGHASATITDAVYAERDSGRVMEVVARCG